MDTYLQHVPGRKAVAFAVNVRHGEDLAAEFRRSGVAAASVSGRMSNRERRAAPPGFRGRQLQVLCACDILNEGWDCPDLEVLLMARPTLSKVIYLQQLGRGTRKAPGKECLIVFDFVDNASRYNQSLNLHRVLGKNRYRRGGLVLAPQHLLDAEEERSGTRRTADHGAGDRPVDEGLPGDRHLQLAARARQHDLVARPERELAVAEGRVRGAVERAKSSPTIPSNLARGPTSISTATASRRSVWPLVRPRWKTTRSAIGSCSSSARWTCRCRTSR